MLQLLCRNDVDDFEAWKSAFDDDREAQRDAGLGLLQMWRETEGAGRVWFLFRVNDRDRAQAFLDDPATRHRGERAGVTDAEYRFVETV